MSWSYLQLCNRVLRRLNEVQLTASTFTSAVGFQASVQDSINDALNDIYDAELHWPFLWATTTQTLTNYTQTYNLPTGHTEIDYDSFFLQSNLTANPPIAAKKLRFLSYHDWQERLQAIDFQIIQSQQNNLGNYGGFPDFVFPYQDMQTYGVSTIPDSRQISPSTAKLIIAFDYWFKPTDLVNSTDLIVIPDQFSKVIIDRATYYAYYFRDNVEEAQAIEKKWEMGLQEMRRRLINKEDYMRSDQLPFSRSVSTPGYI